MLRQGGKDPPDPVPLFLPSGDLRESRRVAGRGLLHHSTGDQVRQSCLQPVRWLQRRIILALRFQRCPAERTQLDSSVAASTSLGLLCGDALDATAAGELTRERGQPPLRAADGCMVRLHRQARRRSAQHR